ncbi:hypothetical protein BJV74DRAFT_871826 [Russula compacta]|nr:hypothetical protein BJV74DRAFT_871826 [Russula compacta]
MERSATSYEILTDDQVLRDVMVSDHFIGPSFIPPGKIQPVEVTIPSITDDEEVVGTPSARIDLEMDMDKPFEESSVRKGKRKAVD